MRVALTGAGGQVAQCLISTAPRDIDMISLGRAECDVTDLGMARSAIIPRRPHVIINTAAYTAVDRAESDQVMARAVNTLGAYNIALIAEEVGIPVFHVSTDYVFDGNATEPYGTDSPAAPVNVYGRTKLEGEQAVMTTCSRAGIVRTSWLYSPYGNNFLKTVLRKIQAKEPVKVVADQVGSPTSGLSLSRVLWRLARMSDARGVLHWCDAGAVSWYEFAKEIQRQGESIGLLSSIVPLSPIATSEYGTPARRPKYSILDSRSVTALTGFKPRPWQEELGIVLKVLAR